MKFTKKEKYDIEKLMIHQQLMFELINLMEEEGLNNTQLAKKLGVSKSYISQLYHGNKLMNVELIAKIMIEFGKKFSTSFEERKPEAKPCPVINLPPSKTLELSDYTLDGSELVGETIFTLRDGTNG